jgi:hypothetical protein
MCCMKSERYLDSKEMTAWTASVGGFKKAAQLIKERLECSRSKAEKLAAGSYNRLPSASEQKELADLVNRSRDQLFPRVSARVRRKAS